jgi:hypothetical protein
VDWTVITRVTAAVRMCSIKPVLKKVTKSEKAKTAEKAAPGKFRENLKSTGHKFGIDEKEGVS